MASSKTNFSKIAENLISFGLADQSDALSKNKPLDYSERRVKRTSQLEAIISQIGWPTIALVGKEASWAAWLIAQHSDHSPSLQKKCLELVHSAYQQNQINPLNFAYLTDRVAVNLNQPQIFGTQWSDETTPHPIADQDNLDLRRLSVGLTPFEFSLAIRQKSKTWDEVETESPLSPQFDLGRFHCSRL